MEMQNNRVAIVTGASRGIGASLATRLAADGFKVVVNYSSSENKARKVITAIESRGGKAVAVKADVSAQSEMRALFDRAEDEFGRIDVLINNAGVLKVSPLAQVKDEDYENQISVNLTGAFNGMREASGRLQDGGRIINLSTSIIGHYIPAHGVYVATKAAVEAMTHVLAKELGPRGITVNAVAPGPIGTKLLLSSRPVEFIQALVKDIPLGRLGEPDDIAKIVSFLASDESAWINGQIIRANGGRN
jgi:3-oxoacyl-[acyl-carrier protein] reductase